jgi:outer membrane protein OmpA-like peptidoglycan-associated protein
MFKVGLVKGVLYLLLFSAVSLYGQTAGEMDVLLETPAVSFAQAARFTLASAGVLDGQAVDAYALARENGWLPAKAEAAGSIRLGELCFLMMKAFNIKGSFLYSLFPGPRYAFRELDYRKLIPGRRDPALKVSGEDFLRILGIVGNYAGPAQVIEPAAIPAPAAPPPPPVERERTAELIQANLEQNAIKDTTVRVEETGIVISLNNIQFLPDSVELTETEKVKIREIAAILSQYPGSLLVAGHAAMAGSEEGQMRISRERAEAVADFLVGTGVRRQDEVTVEGFGAGRPLGDNATTEGQALNRRVEIILLDK